MDRGPELVDEIVANASDRGRVTRIRSVSARPASFRIVLI